MAPDRLPPTANPTSADSDPEEEEEEDIEEDEEEQVDADVVNHKSAEADSDSEEEEEDEADEAEEEEEEDESSEKTASPTRRLDYGSDADSGKTVPSPCVSDFVVKQNSETKKRLAESEPVKEKSEVKKLKKEKKKGDKENGVVAVVEADNVVSEDKGKRSSGPRIWGPEDEIVILTGMLDYKEKTGVDFNSNLDAFYHFIKGQLNAVVDKTQLVNKIRKLKEKYRDSAAKEANGATPVFLKSHEADVYEHSKNVWGGNAVARSKSRSKKEKEVATEMPPKSKKEKEVVTEMPDLEVENVLALPVPELDVCKKDVNGGSAKAASRVPKVEKKPKVVQKMDFKGADVEIYQKDSVIPMPVMVDGLVYEKGLELVEKSKVDALNEKWTKYQLDAAELYVRRLDLIKEQTELILDALTSNP